MSGEIIKVSGPAVVARGMAETRMYNRVIVGPQGLQGEVIRLRGEEATIQVYEETTGLSLGDEVLDSGEPLFVELGPGLLGAVFDGIQRSLEVLREAMGDLILRRAVVPPLSRTRRWHFVPQVRPGQVVGPGDVLGAVRETPGIEHRVLLPPRARGGRVAAIAEGEYAVTDTVGRMEGGEPLSLLQRWPVRQPRPIRERLGPEFPFLTGQRIFDQLFPVAAGGTAIVPGGFGTGKTVVEQSLAKFAEADLIVFIGCGERGNEIAEVLSDFPRLIDRRTGRPLMERTILVVNTSNMPVAAREASIYTGITLAEYYRDMGYRVALMADSTSRWAEALREISSRLEEMPGEEGYPTYLAARLATFYERGGRAVCLGEGDRVGSITIVSAISPPGGDFSEPVTQASIRATGALWALEAALAHRRHFPAVEWKRSYSLYVDQLREWYTREVGEDWHALRQDLLALLRREEEIQEIVQLVGIDAIQDEERLMLEMGRLFREEFLRQSAFSEVDAFCPLAKQHAMLRLLFAFYGHCRRLLQQGTPIDDLLTLPLRRELERMKEQPAEGFGVWAEGLMKGMANEK
jgi:V/A-type H+-transporting ATPase subunit A